MFRQILSTNFMNYRCYNTFKFLFISGNDLFHVQKEMPLFMNNYAVTRCRCKSCRRPCLVSRPKNLYLRCKITILQKRKTFHIVLVLKDFDFTSKQVSICDFVLLYTKTKSPTDRVFCSFQPKISIMIVK